jgi:hypothetical protein
MANGWTVAGITKQVKRLRAIPRQEDDRPWAVVAPEFERVLQQLSDDDAHAERITSHVMDTARFCPSVPELRELAGQLVARTEEEIRPNPDCAACGGSGDVVVERGGFSGSKRCDCWARRPLPSWAQGERSVDMPRAKVGLQAAAEVAAMAGGKR